MHVYWKVYLRFYETLMCTCPCDKDPLLVYPGSKIWWKHLKWTDLGLPKLISFFLFESGLHLTTLIAFQILFLLKFTIQRNIRSAHWKKKCFFFSSLSRHHFCQFCVTMNMILEKFYCLMMSAQVFFYFTKVLLIHASDLISDLKLNRGC